MNKRTFFVLLVILLLNAAIAVVYVYYPSQIEKIRNLQSSTTAIQVATSLVPLVDNSLRGQLEYLEGKVEKRLSADEGWKSMEKAEVVKSGMEIRTLTASKAIITFEDGSIARLDENSQVRFSSAENKINITFDEGAVYNKVAKDEQREYTVTAGDFSVTALGTIFNVEKKANENPEVVVLESQVAVKDKDGNLLGNVATGEQSIIEEKEVKKVQVTQDKLNDKFIAWNVEKDKVVIEKKKEEAEQTKQVEKKEVANNGKLVLSGKKTDTGVNLYWEVSGLDTSGGFKIVRSVDANPVYPGDEYKYITDKNARSASWDIATGKKYHFRVCQYNGGKCVAYSNDIVLETPSKSEDKDNDGGDEDYATSVKLTAKKDGEKVKLSWSISGGDAPKGFKVVIDTDKNPVYPGNEYHYLSDSGTRSDTWSGLDDGKTYHFRVCVYKGGSCGTYSNDVSVEF